MAPQKSKKSKVRVIARLRPEKAEYKDSSCSSDMPSKCVRHIDSKTLEVWNWRNGNVLQYQFDGFFGERSKQKEIYQFSIGPVLPYVLQGENASVFAYGPTGAGKTYTMLGTPQMEGVTPQCLFNIFAATESEENKSSEWKFEILFSYLEIYQEKVNDLLDKSKQDLPIRQDFNGNIFIPTLTEKRTNNYQEFDQMFQGATPNRKTASTKLNPHSSRSHSIVLIKVIRMQQVAPFRKLTGKIYLVDLAGSEDNRRTGNEGVRLKESGAINGSLFALGQVVDALNSGKPRIPYRNSKLTRLLQDSLGGSAHTCIIANIAPEPTLYTDTLNTLNFATKSRTIINKPFITQSYDRNSVYKRKLQTPDVPDVPERPKKILKKEVNPSGNSRTDNLVIPAGILSPFREKQDDLEDRMMALERRLLVETQNLTQNNEQRRLSKRSPFKDVSNSIETQQEVPRKSKGKLKTTTLALSQQVKHSDSENVNSFSFKIDSTMQAAYDAELLHVLNNGEIKKLKTLHAIGDKRARLIANWRDLNGPFTQILDLANIEGFTFKMADTFRKKNLLDKMVFA